MLHIVAALRAKGLVIAQQAVEQGLANTRFVGRMEIVRRAPLCMIDGAHNPEKIRALCQGLDSLYADRSLVCVMGMLQKKEYEVCIPMLASRSAVFIAVTPPGDDALPAEQCAALARPHCAQVHVCDDPEVGARLALSYAKEGSLVLACGSMYLLGQTKNGFLTQN